MSAEISVQLAHAFIDNFNDQSADAPLYTDGATLWNNITEVDQPAGDGHGMGRKMQEALPDLRFDDAVAHGWDGGFVVQYVVAATLPDGTQMRAPACGVGQVQDGRIARFQEYVDSGQVAGLATVVAGLLEQTG